MLELEDISCPFCGTSASDLLYKVRDCYTRQPGEFTFVRCRRCGLVYLNPRPTVEVMESYYASYEVYNLKQRKPSLLPQWLIQYGLWKRCRPLLRTKSEGRVLDIGCGTGHFLAAMRKYSGWTGIGVDRSPEAIAFARDVLGVEAIVSRIEAMEFPDRAFDAVTLWDTLEHFHYPYRALLEIRRILKPFGYLLLRVPSLDSLDVRLFGPYWAGLDAPRHLTLFSRETLARLLTEAGFTIKQMWCMSGSHASFVLSLRFLLACAEKPNVLLQSFQKFIASPAGSLLSAPYFFTMDKLQLGPEITVLVQKEEGKSDDRNSV